MMWPFNILLLILLGLATVMTSVVIQRHRRLVALRQDHRTIHWEDALRRIRAEHGMIAEVETSLFGHLWWVSDSKVEAIGIGGEKILDPRDEVENYGLCVIDAPSRTTVEQTVSDQGLTERYLVDDQLVFVD